MDDDRPQIDDYLAVASLILGIHEDTLLPAIRIDLAESALAAPYAEFASHAAYPDPVERAAILGSRIVRNHALPDGNKRTGLIMMLDELRRIGIEWGDPDQDEIADMIERLAGKEPTITEAEFVAWVRANTA